jgi:hypothetical protein
MRKEEDAMSCEDEGPKTATECSPCSPAVRNRYFRGKLMTVADYEAEQRYMIHRRRVVNRMLLGCGIVSGFRVGIRDDALEIGRGVALDRRGRELIACKKVAIRHADDLIWLWEDSKCGLKAGAPFEPGCYLLSAHYAERPIDGVRVSTGCGDSGCETNRICETVAYSLRSAAGLPLLALPCGDLEPREGQLPSYPEGQPHVGPVDDRGQAGLCLREPRELDEHGFDPCRPGRLSRVRGLDVDFEGGVALAHVCFRRGECGELVFFEIRDIIRGCELVRIKDIGWRNWHDDPGIVIGRTPFSYMFVRPAEGTIPQSTGGEDDDDNVPAEKPTYPHIDTRFWVCFSGPVQIASLNRDVISITLVQPDGREAVGNMVRVPIGGIWHLPTLEGDPPGTTRGFRPFVLYQFWQGEIQRGARTGFNSETLVEIRIRGQAIIDWAGRPIDGDSIAQRLPSGNGTPGGEFLSSWRVKRGGVQEPPRGKAIPWPVAEAKKIMGGKAS